MAILYVHRGERTGDVIQLDRDVIVLGRSPDCDEVISKQETVSRWHARILRINDSFYVEDHEESRNRTFVNEQKIPYHTQVALGHQDEIRICEFEATFLAYSGDSTVEVTLSSKSDHRLETQPAAKLAILLDITAKLTHSLQLQAQLPDVGEGLLRMFPQADRCFVILVDEATGNLRPELAQARVHVDPIKLQFSRTIVRQALNTGESLLFREGDPIPAGGHSVSLFQIRSVMCVPMSWSDDKCFGVIQLDTQDASKKFTRDDLQLLSGVANQVALAMENARLHEQRLKEQLSQERARNEQERIQAELEREQERVRNELEIARNVQLNFLPKKLPDVPGYEFFAFYEAAREVGGDYYDFIPLPGKRWAITVGDVAGKGMPAALLMARLSSESRSCLLTEPDFAAAVAKLNDQLHPFTSPMDRFVTLIAAILDPASHTVTLVNAGHTIPFLYRWSERKYTKAVPPEDDGQSLGLEVGARYQSYSMTLSPGDSLVFYSDGVTDAQNSEGKAFRMKGIYNVFETEAPNSPKAMGECLVNSVTNYVKDGVQYDDIALVCFGRPAS